MEVSYKNKKLENVCQDFGQAKKKYGINMAIKIHQRIDEIRAAETIEIMIKFRIGRCHELEGNRKGQYAVDLVHPYRMVFEVVNGEVYIANIIEIIDYH